MTALIVAAVLLTAASIGWLALCLRGAGHSIKDMTDEIEAMRTAREAEATSQAQIERLRGDNPLVDELDSFDLHVDQALEQAEPSPDLHRVH